MVAGIKKWGWARKRAARGWRKTGVQKVSVEPSGSGVWARGGAAPASRLLQGSDSKDSSDRGARESECGSPRLSTRPS